MKLIYNRPQILNRLNAEKSIISTTGDSLITKKDYNKLYEQYENNIDFWSLKNLKNNLQKNILNNLLTYW